eukprot:TRINITY_DN387_c0_g1_i1.p1 TRINITY_DN387_c0_g1~~TRINITY_DN387_c0_g1_i1.p1  ORF type:complete len:443 (+),score=121.42 TRINITY_DN387_c0_g1_i1:49-1377(+)
MTARTNTRASLLFFCSIVLLSVFYFFFDVTSLLREESIASLHSTIYSAPTALSKISAQELNPVSSRSASTTASKLLSKSKAQPSESKMAAEASVIPRKKRHTTIQNQLPYLPVSLGLAANQMFISVRSLVKNIIEDSGKMAGHSGAILQRSVRNFGPFKTCAVVGNGGSIMAGSYGEEIDSHDFVLRFNAAPTGDDDPEIAKVVGKKTSSRLVNHQYLRAVMSSSLSVKENSSFQSHAKMYRNSTDFLGKADSLAATRSAGRLEELLDSFGENDLIVNEKFSQFLLTWGFYGKKTSGVFGALVAVNICERVDIYGFGSHLTQEMAALVEEIRKNPTKQLQTPGDRPTSFNHYFSDALIAQNRALPMINMEWQNEMKMLKWMHAQGIITMHPQPDRVIDSETLMCLMSDEETEKKMRQGDDPGREVMHQSFCKELREEFFQSD